MAELNSSCSRRCPASFLKYPLATREFADFAELTLRPATVRDAPAFADAVNASLPELRHFMSWAFHPQTCESQRERIAAAHAEYWGGRDFIFGVFAQPGDILVGSVGLHPRTLNPLGFEIGYWAHSRYASQGLTTLATKCMIVYGFSYLGLTKLACGHDEANLASARVNDKCGFLIEGRLRNHEGVATQDMRSGGYRGSGAIVTRGLIPSDVTALAWYEGIKAKLQVFDWQERLVRSFPEFSRLF